MAYSGGRGGAAPSMKTEHREKTEGACLGWDSIFRVGLQRVKKCPDALHLPDLVSEINNVCLSL